MDFLGIAKIVSFFLVLTAVVYAYRTLEDKARIYLIAAMVLFLGSIMFFFEQDFSPRAVLYDWIKHFFVYGGLVAFYFFWASFVKSFGDKRG